MDAKSEKKSLAQLRAEVKELRKTLYKPISRSKKGDLEAEIARHKGVSAPASTKSEAVATPAPKEEQPKKTKTEKAGKKAEAKPVKPKTEKKSEPKPKKETKAKKTDDKKKA